jgi:hypothetical protein
MPAGTSGLLPGTSTGTVICRAQGWEWNMEPNGITCDKITEAICNPSTIYWDAWIADPDVIPSCACINQDAFIEKLFGPPGATGYPKTWQSSIETFKTYIQCFSTECRNNPLALKNSTGPPYDKPCPSLTTCIISEISNSGKLSPITIINNCGGNVTEDDKGGQNDAGDGEIPGGLLGAFGIILAVSSVFAILAAAFIIILLRRRSKRHEELEILRQTSTRTQKRRQATSRQKRHKHKDYGEDDDDDYENSSEEEY